jgi:hypothetical protein
MQPHVALALKPLTRAGAKTLILSTSMLKEHFAGTSSFHVSTSARGLVWVTFVGLLGFKF